MATLIRDKIVDNAVGWLYGSTEMTIGLTVYAVDPRLETGLVIYIVVFAVLGLSSLVLTRTRVPGKIGGWMAKIAGGVAPEQIEPLPWGTLVQVAACYIGSRTLGLLEKVTLLWALDLPHDLATAAFVDGFISAAGYVGFMIPQGLGVFEGATAYLIAIIGGPGAAGIAFAFARRGRMLVIGLFGVFLHVVAIARNAIRRAT
jgi:hypothetical protein